MQQPETWDTTGGWDDAGTGGWDDEPAAASAAVQQQSEPAPADNWASWGDAPASAASGPKDDWAAFPQETQNEPIEAAEQPVADEQPAAETYAEPVSTVGLEQATVLYNFDAQNSDELTITENEVVYIANEECDEEGWVVIVNAQGQKGYVPQNYLEMGEAAPAEAEAQPSFVEEPTQPWPNTQDYYRFVFDIVIMQCNYLFQCKKHCTICK